MFIGTASVSCFQFQSWARQQCLLPVMRNQFMWKCRMRIGYVAFTKQEGQVGLVQVPYVLVGWQESILSSVPRDQASAVPICILLFVNLLSSRGKKIRQTVIVMHIISAVMSTAPACWCSCCLAEFVFACALCVEGIWVAQVLRCAPLTGDIAASCICLPHCTEQT